MPVRKENSTIYLGIDPGASGGLASLQKLTYVYGEYKLVSISMPLTERDVWEWFDLIAGMNVEVTAVIEQVGGYVGDGGNPGSAMFKFGQSYGGLRMALTAAGIRFQAVTPQVWQKAMGIPKRKAGESKTVWKNRLKAKAQQLFPDADVTLKTADAILIAEFCRRKETGIL